jgi:rare lipoprotein A
MGPDLELSHYPGPMNRLTSASLLVILATLGGCAMLHKQPYRQPPAPAPAAPVSAPTSALMRPSPAPPPLRASVVSPQQPGAEEPVFTQTGLASFYGRRFNGNKTASGDKYDGQGFTAAHRTLAFGTIVRVTNTANGRIVKVLINDRGPHVRSRVIDLSHAAAHALGIRHGIAHVRLEVFLSDQAESAQAG